MPEAFGRVRAMISLTITSNGLVASISTAPGADSSSRSSSAW
jgi:hypothetical protein